MKTTSQTQQSPVLKQGIKWYPYGHDLGNTDTIDTTRIGSTLSRSAGPTAICDVDPTVMRNLSQFEIATPEKAVAKKGKGKNNKGKSSQVESSAALPQSDTASSVIQLKGGLLTYAVGDFAMAQNKRVWSGRGRAERYATEYSVMSILTHAVNMISDKEFGLFVVTGLPADHYTKNFTLRSAIKEALDGTYTFSMDGGQSWRTAHIVVSLVIMEGAGALLAYASRMKLAMTKSTLGGCIDIGGGTVDLYAARGAVPTAEYCKSDRNAVEAAGQMIRRIFTSKHPGSGLSDLEVREIMYAYVNKNDFYLYPQVSVLGVVVAEEELENIAREAIHRIADDIVTFVAAAWEKIDGGARFDPLLLVGGGYYYFFEEIKAHESLSHIRVLDPTILGEHFPTDANAEGYVQLAARRLQIQQEEDKVLLEQIEAQRAQAEQASEEQQHGVIEEQDSLLEEEELHAAATAAATKTLA